MLARQAACILDALAAGLEAPQPMADVARRLGVSDRHLRRIFDAQLGVSPLQYLMTRRLLSAKQLLTDTGLPVTRIAMASGFSSLRRFNAAFTEHYGLNPTALRRTRVTTDGLGDAIHLGYRPPYALAAMRDFLARRCVGGLSFVDDAQPDQALIGQTLRVTAGAGSRCGWLTVRFDPEHHRVALRISESLCEALPLVIARVRAWLDLDADPAVVDACLDADPLLGAGDPAGRAGLRVPGCLDGFELAVRAVLGQQITVVAARTLCERLVNTFGEPVQTPWPALSRLFPTPAVLAGALPEQLGALGIVRQRQQAIIAIARAVATGDLRLEPGADPRQILPALTALPGVGDWTAQYVAMRALRWPDAFPAGDIALQKALGLRGSREAEQRSLAWRPWRSYAVLRAWHGAGTMNTPVSIASNDPIVMGIDHND